MWTSVSRWFQDPVIANDGFTYCRKCAPSLARGGYASLFPHCNKCQNPPMQHYFLPDCLLIVYRCTRPPPPPPPCHPPGEGGSSEQAHSTDFISPSPSARLYEHSPRWKVMRARPTSVRVLETKHSTVVESPSPIRASVQELSPRR